MKFDDRWCVTCLSVLLTGIWGFSAVEAGCPCNRGGATSSGSALQPIPMSASPEMSPYPVMMPPQQMPISNPVGMMPEANGSIPLGAAVPGAGPGYSAATATTWQPPAGTIGQTYQMKSRPIPVKMHPRAAIVDVRIPDAKSVRVHDMNVYRTQDFLEGFQDDQDPKMWHFTSEPLIPGIPHIYRIEARIVGEDGEEKMEERFVRLIMGRVIEVAF